MNYMGINNEFDNSKIVLLGIPYDGTSSYRSGSKFAPLEIRTNSLIGYETYSPRQDKDLVDKKIYDFGDIEVPYTSPKIVQNKIYEQIKGIIEENKKIAVIGGEHSISYGVVKALNEKYTNLKIIQLDAHTDLRDEYLGDKYSHASVMKRICEEVGSKNVYQLGIRSGLKEEFEYAKANTNIYKYNLNKIKDIVDDLEEEKVYITIDLDVLDPAFFPGTGTPEPGGVTTNDLLNAIHKISELKNIIGFDIVELSPNLDNSQISTSVGITILKEMLLTL